MTGGREEGRAGWGEGEAHRTGRFEARRGEEDDAEDCEEEPPEEYTEAPLLVAAPVVQLVQGARAADCRRHEGHVVDRE